MKNKYKMYLNIAGQVLNIPVLPTEYKISYPTDHTTYNVLDIGEIVVPRLPSLQEISFDSYFPGSSRDLMLMGNRWTAPGNLVKAIETALNKALVVEMVIGRYDAAGNPMYDTSQYVVIEKFETTEKGGEAGDIYYTITLQQYKDFSPQKVTIPKPTAPARVQTTQNQRPVTNNAIRVGAQVIVNGPFWFSSWGAKPSKQASNLRTTITRIITDPTRAKPICVGDYGWVTKNEIQVIS